MILLERASLGSITSPSASTPKKASRTIPAAHEVFAIPELLENILLHIRPSKPNQAIRGMSEEAQQPLRALFVLRRVSRTFLSTIEGSPSLQVAMGLRQALPMSANVAAKYRHPVLTQHANVLWFLDLIGIPVKSASPEKIHIAWPEQFVLIDSKGNLVPGLPGQHIPHHILATSSFQKRKTWKEIPAQIKRALNQNRELRNMKMCGFRGVEKHITVKGYKWYGRLDYETAKSLGVKRRWSFKSTQDTTLGELYDDLMRWDEVRRRVDIHDKLDWELTRRNRLL